MLHYIRKMKKETIFLILLLAFAFFLRIYSLGTPTLWIDESISVQVSSNILETGTPVLDSGALYSRAFFFHYAQAFFLIFGANDFNIRIISVIFGLATIVLGYFIGKEYSKSGGIITALFLTVFYLEVFYSRQGRFYALFQLMFFLSIYLLYKSREEPKYIWLALVSFIITVDTHIAGIILAPLFIWQIALNKGKKKYWTWLLAIPVIYKIFILSKLSSYSGKSALNYTQSYYGYASNFIYLLILSIVGTTYSYIKNKRLTMMIILPSLALLVGVFFLETFAIRYAYFFVFPIILYSSLLISYLYEKYGNVMIIAIIALLLVPSNIIFPQTYTTVIKPIGYNLYDNSAPVIDYKNIPIVIKDELKQPGKKLFAFFSPSLEWYIKKPDYVFPFSLDGRANNEASYSGKDIYSGAQLRTTKPSEDFYFIADHFSLAKLTSEQVEEVKVITAGCEDYYENSDLKIYHCLA